MRAVGSLEIHLYIILFVCALSFLVRLFWLIVQIVYLHVFDVLMQRIPHVVLLQQVMKDLKDTFRPCNTKRLSEQLGEPYLVHRELAS
ncbi:hypothetical protein AWB82_07196 [Caballeronia glebae]|uniref:Uncharacterized protein n=1 Tax=Caballeronia glebae TaxID=1777143 RepID=A0A158DVN5_9BURK|nr:hypothetical protein AWB82_07196 [Caballeronia glebae]